MAAGQIPELSFPIDEFRAAQRSTRTCRLALNILREELPGGTGSDEIARVLAALSDALAATEEQELAAEGVSWQYLIIRPVNPADPPPPGDMEEITAAVRTLIRHGMIISDTP